MRWSKSDLPVDLVPRHKVIDPKRDQRPHQPCQQGIAVFTDHAHFRQSPAGWVALPPVSVDKPVASTSIVPHA